MRDYVEQLVEEGLEGLPRTERAAAPRKEADIETARASASPVREPVRATPRLFSQYPGLEKTADLRELREFIGDCRRCKLAPGRTNLVFGVGDPRAELMFVGEGPGADEDAKG